ncbi:Glycerol-3-phosphate phosphatase [Seminavis robusta]|uniref:Glycerol-3-phosphate phosphatase n=1 Tax=Seminavis robusta TaxID=568900 RepID=A0A9N8EHC0_9STRA|nr:Glycerol-3-phosphate phosphatase [Seminavis robusta]|eukprot:Sro1099_g241120.1 Glycerol-3-phosphate phosphatase (319) ;mRNA; f:19978-20934
MSKVTKHFEGRPNAPLLWQSNEEASSFVQKHVDTILFDADGCLYRTPDPIPGATDCVNRLMALDKKVLFVTNNAGVSRKQLQEKLSKILGVDGLTEDQLISSSYAAAKYMGAALQKRPRKRVHVIGTHGLCQELEGYGFDISGGPTEDKAGMTRDELASYGFPEDPVDAVVVGHDVEFSFRKLSIANNLLLRNPECLFVATNKDAFDLVGADGRHIPGNGATVAALECCSGRMAINVGKPSPALLDVILQDHNFETSRSLFVGDRLDTDIKFAVDSGMFSALVMTGVTTAEMMIAQSNDPTCESVWPSAILSHVGKLV